MEGNECYKFSTIKGFVERTRASPIRRIVDVGANVGDILVMMAQYFPHSSIVGFEPVEDYFHRACAASADLSRVSVRHQALSYEHLYADDLGEVPRENRVPLKMLRALPTSGAGWIGGSMILPADHPWIQGGGRTGYELDGREVWPLTLENLLQEMPDEDVDILKLDCEGSENSILGCASRAALDRVRYIVGEYHGLERFYNVMSHRLFKTHKVNLVGKRDLGAFFAERLDGERDGILKFDRTGMLQVRSWLSRTPMEWNLFNEAYVEPAERSAHGF